MTPWEGEAHSKHLIVAPNHWRVMSAVLQSDKCGFLGHIWTMRHQRYDGWFPCAEAARREQGRRCPGQRGGHLLRGVLRNTANARPSTSDVAVDLGWIDRHHQDYQSDICTGRPQTSMLSPHRRQQIDWPSALHGSSYGVLVHRPNRYRGRCRQLCGHPGRSFHRNTEDVNGSS